MSFRSLRWKNYFLSRSIVNSFFYCNFAAKKLFMVKQKKSRGSHNTWLQLDFEDIINKGLKKGHILQPKDIAFVVVGLYTNNWSLAYLIATAAAGRQRTNLASITSGANKLKLTPKVIYLLEVLTPKVDEAQKTMVTATFEKFASVIASINSGKDLATSDFDLFDSESSREMINKMVSALMKGEKEESIKKAAELTLKVLVMMEKDKPFETNIIVNAQYTKICPHCGREC